MLKNRLCGHRQRGDREWAEVAWDAAGRVYSERFGDWYSGELCAYDEAMEVYCAGLELPNAWNNFVWNNFVWNNFSWNNFSWNNFSWSNFSWSNFSWSNFSWSNFSWNNFPWASRSFRLTELGFGAGVNFLQTQRLWQEWHEEWQKEWHKEWHSKRAEPPPKLLLDYYGIERYPMRECDLRRTHEELSFAGEARSTAARSTSKLLELWRELERYPRRRFFRWRLSPSLRLTLLLEDAAQALARISKQSVDGWYLDGFAIGGNSGMWSEEVFSHIARCTRARALVAGVAIPQLASFSVARKVRDRATSCGFRVHKRARAITCADKKIETLPKKREVLQGFFPRENPTSRE